MSRGGQLRMRILGPAAAILIGTAAICLPLSASSAPAHAPNSANARLRALYNGFSAWQDKEFGSFQDSRGEQQQAGYLPHVDEASQLRREAHEKDLLAKLGGIPKTQLSADEQVNAAVFRTILENDVSDYRFRTWEMPFNSDSSFWTYLDGSQPFDDTDGYRRYLARMRDIPRYFDEQIANMRAGLARGFSVPRATLDGRDKSVAAFIVDE